MKKEKEKKKNRKLYRSKEAYAIRQVI